MELIKFHIQGNIRNCFIFKLYIYFLVWWVGLLVCGLGKCRGPPCSIKHNYFVLSLFRVSLVQQVRAWASWFLFLPTQRQPQKAIDGEDQLFPTLADLATLVFRSDSRPSNFVSVGFDGARFPIVFEKFRYRWLCCFNISA